MKWAVLGLLGLVASVPLQQHEDSVIESQTVGFVQLEQTTAASAYSQCSNTGISHAQSFTGSRFSVSGQGEWVVAEGPSDTEGTPHWVVQTYQGNWRSCGATNPDVSATKDVAIKCGSWMVLASSPAPVDGCLGNGYAANTQVFTRFFVNGTDTNDKIYEGQDIYETLVAGKSLTFPQGSIDVLQVGCKGGCRFDDEKIGGSRCLGVSVKCAGTEVVLHLEKSSMWDGGSLFNLYVRVPRDSPDDKIRCGTDTKNLQGGYCGCWQGSGEGSLYETVRSKFDTCVSIRPHFYDPEDSKDCRKPFFMTTDANSLFRKFALNSEAKSLPQKYSLARNPNKVADGDAATAPALKLAENGCKDTLSQVLGFTPDQSATVDPRIFLTQSCLGDCIADTVNGVEWDVNTAKRMFCETVSFRIQEERRDVYCAFKMLDEKLEKFDPDGNFGKLLVNSRTPQDAAAIRQLNADALKLANEVESSLKNIKFWYFPGCESNIADSNDLVSDCVGHQFIDTSSLACAESPPLPNALWDKKCSSRLGGDKCTARCSATSTAYPNGTPTPVGFTCTIAASAAKTLISWEPDTQFQCCKTTGCEKHPTKVLTGLCEAGQFTCKDCAPGQAASNGKCVDVACPVNSTGFPECKCIAGYAGSLSWSASKGKWEGQCVAPPCPENAVNPTACICGVGTAGTLRWDLQQQKWVGSCTTCTDGFSNSTGLGKCLSCTVCDAKQEESIVCNSTSDRQCVCKAGTQIDQGKCEDCPAGTYKNTAGDTLCKPCTNCNTNTEDVRAVCTPTSNTECAFKPE
eukprot:c32663_g1_i1.p1 GENE.c32663_g1_i1~~c32663_g1_i1.p1  ORF type:complete len:797 (+),score=103.38 c32663_g1_i1:42-2432(+)